MFSYHLLFLVHKPDSSDILFTHLHALKRVYAGNHRNVAFRYQPQKSKLTYMKSNRFMERL